MPAHDDRGPSEGRGGAKREQVADARARARVAPQHHHTAEEKGDRLRITNVFATEVRARAMMKHIEAVAKHEAISTPGQPISRTTTAQPAAPGDHDRGEE